MASQSGSDSEMVYLLRKLRQQHPAAGAKALLALIKEQRPSAALGAKEVRAVLRTLDALNAEVGKKLCDALSAVAALTYTSASTEYSHEEVETIDLLLSEYTAAMRSASRLDECKHSSIGQLVLSCVQGSDTEKLVAVAAADPAQFPVGQVSTIKKLLAAGADARVACDGESLLQVLISIREYEVPVDVGEVLIEDGGADVNWTHDNSPWPVIMTAALCGRVDWVRMLLRQGADHTLRAHGISALDVAAEQGHSQVVKAIHDQMARDRTQGVPSEYHGETEGIIDQMRRAGGAAQADMLEAIAEWQEKKQELDKAPDDCELVQKFKRRAEAEMVAKMAAVYPEGRKMYGRKLAAHGQGGKAGWDDVLAAEEELATLKRRTAREQKAVAREKGCGGCGAAETEMQLKACKGCALAYYCSHACQVRHWRQGHKAECRAANRKAEMYPLFGGVMQHAP